MNLTKKIKQDLKSLVFELEKNCILIKISMAENLMILYI